MGLHVIELEELARRKQEQGSREEICPLAEQKCNGAEIPAVLEVRCSKKYEECIFYQQNKPIQKGVNPLTIR